MTVGSRPNVVLLTIDTLRPDRLGCYGSETTSTPHLDRLASHGTLFRQAITPGAWTQAAFPALLTSTYGSMYGGCRGALLDERPSPVEALQRSGYRTAAFSASPLLGESYGYARGFDEFVELTPTETAPQLLSLPGSQRFLRSEFAQRILGAAGIRLRPAAPYVSAATLTDRVIDWIDAAPSSFFLWVHYMDVHWPYHLAENLADGAAIAGAWRDVANLHAAVWKGRRISERERRRYVGLYEAAVEYTDRWIGMLLERIDQATGRQPAVIAMTADHGEEFQEHGRWGHLEDNLYDEILRVPLILRVPGEAEGRAVEAQVSTIDLMPTLLGLAGVAPPEGTIGSTLLPERGDGERDGRAHAVFSEGWLHDSPLVAVRTEHRKFIWRAHAPDEPQLFDLKDDPGERENLATQRPQEVRSFQQLVDEHRARVSGTACSESVATPDLSDEVLRRMRALGYLE